MTRVLLAIVLALAAALGWSLWRAEIHKGAAESAAESARQAQASAAAIGAVLETERARADQLADVAEKHQEELTDAQDRADRLAAELRAGERRVRHEIAALHTARLSAGTAAARELEASAQRGAELVAAAVGVGAKCDAVQRGLIEAYEAVR